MDWMDLFEFSNFSFGGMAIVTGLYSSLQRERKRRSDRERERENQ